MKKKSIILIAICALLLGLGVGLYFVLDKEEKNPVLTDGQKFSKEYSSVDEDNLFVYRDIDEIITIMEHGTGVVYLGFPECPWCNAYVKYLQEVAKEVGISKIYYYNILQDRTNNTEDYQKIVALLEKELQFDDEGKPRVYVPNVSFHIRGELIGNDSETSLDTKGFDNPEDYWTEDEVKDLKATLKNYMEQVKAKTATCTDCNKD